MKGGVFMTPMAVDFTLLTEAGETISNVVSSAWTTISGNPLTLFFVGVSVIGAGFGLFKRARRSLR